MRAARFIAEQFRLAGLTPAGDSGYFQRVPMVSRRADPSSTITVDGTVLRLGTDFGLNPGRADAKNLNGVQVIFGGVRGDPSSGLTEEQTRGKLVVFATPPAAAGRGRAGGGGGGGAPPPPPRSCREPQATDAPPRGGGGGAAGRGRGRGGAPTVSLADAAIVATIEGEELSPQTIWNSTHSGSAFVKESNGIIGPTASLTLTRRAAEALLGTPIANATVGMTGKTIQSTIRVVESPALGGNVIGLIEGSDPALKNEVVLVDAHYDHLGIRLPAPGTTDSIYNGADDDASGTVAVIEIARAIKAGPPPKRTLIFAATTGEEIGLVGTNWYIAHPVRPLSQMVSNLEIEMIGRPDSLAGGFGKAWLTGYERSTMGDTLAAHGVPIVKDPRPEQQFFQRSDNIAFARMGIPAHTLSTFNLHTDYHRASDEVDKTDFAHMTGVINSAVTAVRLLADRFKPEWYPGCKP
jgi:hypothetical protein